MWNPLTALREFFKSSPSKNDTAKALEQAHKMQFLYLVDATNFYFNLLDKGKAGPVLTNYLVKGTQLAQKWLNRQLQLEKAGVPVYRPVFFSRAYRPEINAKAQKIRAGLAGENEIGFIPVVVWGLVVAGAWAVERIVDQLTTTTEEQTDLLNETAATCKRLGLSPDDCKNVLQQQLEVSKTGTSIFSSGGGTLIKMALVGFAGFLLLNSLGPKRAAA